jgi:hypothetical protein
MGSVRLLLVSLVACEGTDDGTTPPAPLTPEVSLGTGVEAYVPVGDGDPITIVFGPQGGYHLDGSLRAQGIVAGDPDDLGDDDNPLTIFRVWDATGDPISGLEGAEEIQYREGLEPTAEPGVFEMVGRRIFLDIASDDEIVGTTLDVEVEVTDVEGTTVSDRHSLEAVAHPLNP